MTGRGRILECERAYARSHSKIRVLTPEILKEPGNFFNYDLIECVILDKAHKLWREYSKDALPTSCNEKVAS